MSWSRGEANEELEHLVLQLLEVNVDHLLHDRRLAHRDDLRDEALAAVTHRRKDGEYRFRYVARMLAARQPASPEAYLEAVARNLLNEVSAAYARRLTTIDDEALDEQFVDAPSYDGSTADQERWMTALDRVRERYAEAPELRLLIELYGEQTSHARLTDELLEARIHTGEVDPGEPEELMEARKRARATVDQRISRARRRVRAWVLEVGAEEE